MSCVRAGFNYLLFVFPALQSGVKVLIVISILAVTLVILYSVGYQVWDKCRGGK